MADIFEQFTQMYQEEIDRPPLEDGETYPAVLVDGPTSSNMIDKLHVKDGGSLGWSVGMWFTFAVNKGNDPTNFSKAKDIVERRHYLFLGRVDAGAETEADAVKAGFLRGELNFTGTPSAGLRNLRYALYDNEAIKEMGVAVYDFDDFLNRQVLVTIKHEPNPSGGQPYMNLARISRHEDLMGNIGSKLAPEDVAWTPREEREDASNGLF